MTNNRRRPGETEHELETLIEFERTDKAALGGPLARLCVKLDLEAGEAVIEDEWSEEYGPEARRWIAAYAALSVCQRVAGIYVDRNEGSRWVSALADPLTPTALEWRIVDAVEWVDVILEVEVCELLDEDSHLFVAIDLKSIPAFPHVTDAALLLMKQLRQGQSAPVHQSIVLACVALTELRGGGAIDNRDMKVELEASATVLEDLTQQGYLQSRRAAPKSLPRAIELRRMGRKESI